MTPYLKDFPILERPVNGKRLVYLDNASTSQRPLPVIDAMADYSENYNANPHRGLYTLAVESTDRYEHARSVVREFIGAEKDDEIIFTRNTSESLNLLAYSYGLHFLKEGDEILLPISEHHSNLVPWQMVAENTGAKLVYLYTNPAGRLTDEEIAAKLSPKTKLVALAQVSNVLGTVFPVKKIIEAAHEVGAVVVLDCAQSVPHYPVNVQELGADFAAFSAHKMLGPMGIGILYGREELLDAMPPFLTGGDMIEYVYEQEATFAELPYKFEAGTQNVAGAVGLEAAIDYLQKVGYDTIARTEDELLAYAIEGMKAIPHITIYGDTEDLTDRCAVISFNVDGVHPHDVSSILDMDGVAIRAGHHCAEPLHRYLGLNATCRASFYFYNTKEDIDIFLESLSTIRGFLGLGD